MNRWINVEWVRNRINGTCSLKVISLDNLFHILTLAPSIDIVRCKDCKWGKPYSDKQLECDALGLGGLKFPDDFCSYGERE